MSNVQYCISCQHEFSHEYEKTITENGPVCETCYQEKEFQNTWTKGVNAAISSPIVLAGASFVFDIFFLLTVAALVCSVHALRSAFPSEESNREFPISTGQRRALFASGCFGISLVILNVLSFFQPS